MMRRALSLFCLGLVAACGESPEAPNPGGDGSGGAGGAPAETGGTAGAPGGGGETPDFPVQHPSFDEEIAALLGQMTLEEKIAQMVQVEIGTPVDPGQQRAVTLAQVTQHGFGAGLFLGPTKRAMTAEAWQEILRSYQEAALQSRLRIPLLFGIDAVHGHGYFDGAAVIFPHNIGLGASRDPELAQRVAEVTAREVAGTGFNWTFSPTLAVSRDSRWGREYETFGETTELQRLFAIPSVLGLQGRDLTAPHAIAATAKHFIAEGEATWGTGNGSKIDRGDARISEEILRERHLPGYVDAIDAGVQVMMASFSSYAGERVHGSRFLLTELLKEELGFDGFVVSDWRGVYESGLTAVQGINAGVDMHMLPDGFGDNRNWLAFIREVTQAVDRGDIVEARIDDAVTRILRVKFRLGLFEEPHADSSLATSVGSVEHREVAREAVQKSLVLLKNEGGALPLAQGARVVVVGAHGDNHGLQSGGWTKAWQGITTNYAGATSILEGLRDAATDPSNVLYSPDGELVEADVAVIVVGEQPYSEFMGDRAAAELVLPAAQKAYFDTYAEAGIPIVALLVSGRPLVLGDELERSAAFVAAWLPGSEGRGVADVLFGDAPFTGKLPVTWPASVEQIPINAGDASYQPLFEYGFGLEY